jgi:hypothetical protein
MIDTVVTGSVGRRETEGAGLQPDREAQRKNANMKKYEFLRLFNVMVSPFASVYNFNYSFSLPPKKLAKRKDKIKKNVQSRCEEVPCSCGNCQ